MATIKKQEKVFRYEGADEHVEPFVLVAKILHDDRCGNGHNTFAITADRYERYVHCWEQTTQNEAGRILWLSSCGCLHDDIAKYIPELRPLIKWHSVSTDGPLHYIANTVYHADQHGPTYAWVYYTGPSDPLGIGGDKERILGYFDASEAKKVEGVAGYRLKWDETTAKTRNLDHARISAVWPDATDEDLTDPGLPERLAARLPALMAEFKAAVESLGFTY